MPAAAPETDAELDILVICWRRNRRVLAIALAAGLPLFPGSIVALALTALHIPDRIIWSTLAGLTLATAVIAGWWSSQPPRANPVLRALFDTSATVFVRELVYRRAGRKMRPLIHLETTTGKKLMVGVPFGTEKRLVALIAERARRRAAPTA